MTSPPRPDPLVLGLPDVDAPADSTAIAPAPRVPCPDVETFRAHASEHRQRPDGSWTCEACVPGRPLELEATR